MGWGGATGGSSIFGLKDVGYGVGIPFVLSHFDQGADDGSYHLFKKTITLDADRQQLRIGVKR